MSRWYKGNLHMHSFWSDGYGFPEMIAAGYKDRGYHFIAFTEHDRHQTGEQWVSDDPQTDEGKSIRQGDLLGNYIRRFGGEWVQQRRDDGHVKVRLRPLAEYRHLLEEDGRFLILTGEEVSCPYGSGTGDHVQISYLNVFNLSHPLGPQPRAPNCHDAIARVPALVGDAGIVSLNHPNWHYNADAQSVADAAELRFMEIYTALPTCNNDGDATHPSTEQIWDFALAQRLRQRNGRILYGLATDDAHAYEANHHLLGSWALPGRAWVMVRAGELSPAAIGDAMNRGDFYCSTGVELLELDVNVNGSMRLSIQPRVGETCVTRFIASTTDEIGKVVGESRGHEASFTMTGEQLYIRAVIESSLPHPNPHRPGEMQRAWTQPILRKI